MPLSSTLPGLAPRLPSLPRLGSYGSRASSRREDDYQLSPVERESVLKSLGRKSLGGVAAVGNFLDLPGSSVRDLLGGENPFDQWIPGNWTSSENRLTGRDLGERWGLLGRNRKGLDWGDVGGFLGEVALDPLTYMTLGGSALSKAGQAAKKANLLGDLTKVTGKGVGKRVGRMRATPKQLIDLGADATEKAARMAQFTRAGGTADMLNKPLGGLLGLGAPFRQPAGVLGKAGGTAEKIARGMDVAGEAVRYGKYSPIRPLAAGFSTATKGLRTAAGQKLAPDVIRGEAEAVASARSQFAEIADEFDKTGYYDAERILSDTAHPSSTIEEAAKAASGRGSEATRYLEEIGETWADDFTGPDWVRGRLDQMKTAMRDILAREQSAGLSTPVLDDLMAKYFPRMRFSFATGKGRKGLGNSLYQTTHPFQKGRMEFLKDHGGGTDILNELSLDEQVSGIAHTLWRKGQPTTGRPATGLSDIVSVRRHILANYLGPRGITITNKEGEDMLDGLSKWVVNLDPRHQKHGIPAFELNPLKPLLARLEHGERAIKGAEGTIDLLTDSARQMVDSEVTDARLFDVLEKAGLTDEAKFRALDKLAEKFPGIHDLPGMNDAEALKYLKESIFVPADLAADAGRFLKSFQTPEAADPITGAMDWMTNLFKTSVTALWPAFHVRNFVSGSYRNWVGDAFSLDSVKASHTLMRGGTIKGLAKQVPSLGATDVEATRALRHSLFAHDIVHPHQGLAAETLGTAVADPLTRIPGNRPWTPYTPAPVGTTGLQQANPLAVAGVGATADVFAPARVGRNVGYYVEGLNRITPFLEMLKKGVDPAAAARKVKLMQVDYSARAALDPVMRRLLPFWSFTRGAVPFVVENLAQRPGGKMSQTIQAMASAHDPSAMTPEYIGDTASIPLEGTPLEDILGKPPEGTNRYLSGAGLMFEDPLGFLGSGFRGAGLEALSRTNPLLKGPLEWATGQSFFQKTPMGGRPLEDLDPTLGRTISNITGEQYPVELPRSLEALAANSPLTRLFTSARTASDPRKSNLAKAMQLGTGFRIADVSPGAQDAMLQEQIDEVKKSLGGRTFSKSYVPEDVRAQLSPQNLLDAMKMDALERLIRERKKKRRKAAT